MRSVWESAAAARMAARIQSILVDFDPEILSLPGGSIIAVSLWLCGHTMADVIRSMSKRAWRMLIALTCTLSVEGIGGSRL
jgi:hypothetical protein